jgi:hypothetical protein
MDSNTRFDIRLAILLFVLYALYTLPTLVLQPLEAMAH